jgi:tetratricopeptide (TPR) repeat protein
MALALTGQNSLAIEHYQAALRLKPDLLNAWSNLAQALSATNQPDKAVAAARQAVKVARAAGNKSAADEIESLLRQYEKKMEDRRFGPPSAPP